MGERLTAGDLVRQLRARLGIRGDPQTSLEGTIFPVVNLQDMDSPPFHAKSGFSCGLSTGPTAAQFSYVGVMLDATVAAPNARAVVRYIIVSVGGAATQPCLAGVINEPNRAASPLNLASTRPVNSWDTVPATVTTDIVRPVISLRSGTVASQIFPDTPLQFTAPGNTLASLFIPGPWVLAPGNHFLVECLTANIALNVGFYGDEYLVG